LLLAGSAASWWGYRQLDRMPGELLRYAERRLYGHNSLEAVGLPLIALLRTQIERPVPPRLPSLGKGVQPRALPPVRYADDHPLPLSDLADATLPPPPTAQVASLEELQRAMQVAVPGTVIELLPGRYELKRDFKIPARAGAAGQPIVVRAAEPGSVEILSSALEGFIVTQPYWVFENLTMQGVCRHDSSCEHAFHIAGQARGTVIRNNRLLDFNAHLKINGSDGAYPDDGLVQFNTLDNTRPRATPNPVTPIDLVTASRWVVADNLVANFIKNQGDGVSYGLFMKGGGRAGRIERNLVICARDDISARSDRPGAGVRVGISLGGGGTGAGYCRGGPCTAEHHEGVVTNNVVAHCNDAGIDINGASQSIVAHNTLINTGWIDARNPNASAAIYGNWMEGRIRTRNGAWVEASTNVTRSLADFVPGRDALALNWTQQPEPIATSQASPQDFCGRRRDSSSPPGAIGLPGLPCDNAATTTRPHP
jgi:parallel beta-helix repeat protein